VGGRDGDVGRCVLDLDQQQIGLSLGSFAMSFDANFRYLSTTLIASREVVEVVL